MKLLLLLILLTSCNHIVTKELVHDSTFDKYLIEFEEFTGFDSTKMKIRFVPEFKDKHIAGKCFYSTNPVYNFIEINKMFFDHADKLSIKAVIFHELGHCVAKYYKHTKGTLANGCPKSIMNPVLASPECLENNWLYYKFELSILLRGKK